MDVKEKINKITQWTYSIDKAKADIISEMCENTDSMHIAKYFLYPNMQMKHKDFCTLYSKNKKCHDSIKTEELCCYGCNCPNYDVYYHEYSNTNKEWIIGKCKIGSKKGKYTRTANKQNTECYSIWNCTDCIIPHRVEYIKDYIK